jgi:hypothetical protein
VNDTAYLDEEVFDLISFLHLYILQELSPPCPTVETVYAFLRTYSQKQLQGTEDVIGVRNSHINAIQNQLADVKM